MSRTIYGGGGLAPQKYVAGRYYSAPGPRITATRPNGMAVCLPFRLESAATFTGLALEVTTAGSTGALARLAVYADNNGQPGALLLDAGTVAADTTGFKAITGLTLALTPDWHYLTAIVQNAATTAPTFRALTGAVPGAAMHTASNQMQSGAGWALAGTHQGAAPSPATALGTPLTTDTVISVGILA